MSEESNEETTEIEVVKWVEGDQTHGARGKDIKGLKGCIRVKGCRKLGGIEVAIFETAVAFPNRAQRNRDEKWTVKVIGMGAIDKVPTEAAKTRAEAMRMARHPDEWSPKCAKLVEKLAKAKSEAKAEKETAEPEAKAEA